MSVERVAQALYCDHADRYELPSRWRDLSLEVKQKWRERAQRKMEKIRG